MAKAMIFIKTIDGHNLFFEPKFYNQYILLYRKDNGFKEMHRFDTETEAEEFIAKRAVPILEPERYLA